MYCTFYIKMYLFVIYKYTLYNIDYREVYYENRGTN